MKQIFEAVAVDPRAELNDAEIQTVFEDNDGGFYNGWSALESDAREAIAAGKVVLVRQSLMTKAEFVALPDDDSDRNLLTTE